MLRNSVNVLCNKVLINNIQKVKINTLTKKEKWDILSAVCLERKPIITPELNDLEKQYKLLLMQIESERSLKSDHELRHELDVKQFELLQKGVEDLDIVMKQTAQDFVDACTEELTGFKYGSRTTDADKANDVKSLNRKLDKHLVFVLNQKIGDKKYYLLPQDHHQTGETLRQTADRVLKQSCGADVKAQIYGNAPVGFYKYKYPKDVQSKSETVGAKVFIYFARYLKGELPGKGVDYKWLDRQELENSLPSAYKKSVSQLLIDE